MALSQAAIQKKRQKKEQKRQVALRNKTQQLTQLQQIPLVQRGRLDTCWMTSAIHDTGIGNVIITRVIPVTGKIIMVNFLLDLYCLGVKNIFAREDYSSDHQILIDKLQDSPESRLTIIEPEYAKKLILDSVDYANSIGIKPHSDYAKYKSALHDIDNTCTLEFEFGKDGKPLLVSGPHDTSVQIKNWLSAMEKTCGLDNYNYLVEVMQ